MKSILAALEEFGIVPVIAIDDAKDAEPLGRALGAGGLPCAEITFRTDAAKESIRRMVKSFPDMVVGAGTVLTVEQVKQAVDAGAQFIVAPGLNPMVVEYCLAGDIPVIPGVATPSEVERAIGLGLSAVKFFPAEGNGGLAYLKAMGAPYGTMRYIPTGGIDETNLLPYLKNEKIIACGGSWMAGKDMIRKKQFDQITILTERAVQLVLGFDIKHVGINCSSEAEAMAGAKEFSALFKFSINDAASSVYAGTQVELTKRPGPGKNGHLAIGTNFINRAISYFERQGIAVKEEMRTEKDGKLVAIYLDREIGGFAVHLLQV